MCLILRYGSSFVTHTEVRTSFRQYRETPERWWYPKPSRAYMIPVKRIAAPQTEIRQVTPVAAERERAQSDFKETIRNDEPHMPLQKSIKRDLFSFPVSSCQTLP